MADEMGRQVTASGGVMASKPDAAGSRANRGSKTLALAVYADDPKDPDLIGDAVVDIAGTLKHGEFDGRMSHYWIAIAKPKYCLQSGLRC
jgi:neural Wiskott-Aldrich syndrome protein